MGLRNVSSYCRAQDPKLVRVPEAATPQSHKACPQARLPAKALGSEEDSFTALSLHIPPAGPQEMISQTGTVPVCSSELARKKLLPPSEHLGNRAHTTQKLSGHFSPQTRGRGDVEESLSTSQRGELRFMFSFPLKSLLHCLCIPYKYLSEGGFLVEEKPRAESIPSPVLFCSLAISWVLFLSLRDHLGFLVSGHGALSQALFQTSYIMTV